MNLTAPLQVRAGRGMTLRETLYGRSLSAQPGGKWRHPWFLTPVFGGREWAVTVQPGLVNAVAPVVRTTVAEQADAAQRDFGINPLTGRPFFSDDVFQHGPQAEKPSKRVIDIPLYLDPAVPLRFRALGYDGLPGFPVPQFFLDRGAAEAPRVSVDAAGGITTEIADAPRNLRLLRACDVWVHQPRLALTSTITQEPGPLTGISNVTQTLGVRSAVAGDALRVLSGTFARTPIAIDPTQSDYEEQAWDELLIGTVFLLSPPQTAPGSAPDGTWQPFVRHALFWNLCWVPGEFRPLAGDPGTPYIPPLAGGAAQLIINFLTASLNDLTNQALNIVTAHSLAGTFYTATGGGSASAFPPAPAVPPRTGLDKAARLSAARTAAARKRSAARLDPPFPYPAVPFDPALLHA